MVSGVGRVRGGVWCVLRGFTDLYVMGVVAKLFIIVQCLCLSFSLYSTRWRWLCNYGHGL